jgi:hypothetical protein
MNACTHILLYKHLRKTSLADLDINEITTYTSLPKETSSIPVFYLYETPKTKMGLIAPV